MRPLVFRLVRRVVAYGYGYPTPRRPSNQSAEVRLRFGRRRSGSEHSAWTKSFRKYSTRSHGRTHPISIRLSPHAEALRIALAAKLGVNKSAVIEMAIRRMAAGEKVTAKTHGDR